MVRDSEERFLSTARGPERKGADEMRSLDRSVTLLLALLAMSGLVVAPALAADCEGQLVYTSDGVETAVGVGETIVVEVPYGETITQAERIADPTLTSKAISESKVGILKLEKVGGPDSCNMVARVQTRLVFTASVSTTYQERDRERVFRARASYEGPGSFRALRTPYLTPGDDPLNWQGEATGRVFKLDWRQEPRGGISQTRRNAGVAVKGSVSVGRADPVDPDPTLNTTASGTVRLEITFVGLTLDIIPVW
jgi:hypothetical protein